MKRTSPSTDPYSQTDNSAICRHDAPLINNTVAAAPNMRTVTLTAGAGQRLQGEPFQPERLPSFRELTDASGTYVPLPPVTSFFPLPASPQHTPPSENYFLMSGHFMGPIVSPTLSLREPTLVTKNSTFTISQLPAQQNLQATLLTNGPPFTSPLIAGPGSTPSLSVANNAPSDSELILAAAASGDSDAVRRLLATDGELALSRDHLKKTPLILAIEGNHIAIARFLLTRKKTAVRQSKAVDSHCQHALLYAAKHGSLEIAKLLLQLGSWEWQTTKTDNHRVNALTMAIRKNQYDITRLLLACANSEAQVERKNDSGRNALMIAARFGDAVATELILKLPSAPRWLQLTDQLGLNALDTAKRAGKEQVVALLSQSATINSTAAGLENHASLGRQIIPAPIAAPASELDQNSIQDCTKLLFDAIVNLRHGEIRLLCEEGRANALLMQRDDQGRTALMLALSDPAVSTLVDLLFNVSDKDSAIKQTDNEGQTVLMLAAAQGNTAMLATLLTFISDKQSLLTQQSANGDNALMLAAKGGHLAAVKMLLSQGVAVQAQVGATNVHGLHAFQLGLAGQHHEIVSLLSRF